MACEVEDCITENIFHHVGGRNNSRRGADDDGELGFVIDLFAISRYEDLFAAADNPGFYPFDKVRREIVTAQYFVRPQLVI